MPPGRCSDVPGGWGGRPTSTLTHTFSLPPSRGPRGALGGDLGPPAGTWRKSVCGWWLLSARGVPGPHPSHGSEHRGPMTGARHTPRARSGQRPRTRALHPHPASGQAPGVLWLPPWRWLERERAPGLGPVPCWWASPSRTWTWRRLGAPRCYCHTAQRSASGTFRSGARHLQGGKHVGCRRVPCGADRQPVTATDFKPLRDTRFIIFSFSGSRAPSSPDRKPQPPPAAPATSNPLSVLTGLPVWTFH